ncbi:MAG: hypothetical protein GAK28_02308 [Luteibacter sp.]|uniref:DUF2894 domain-containing protein n=1 Tax=Luteibacter sp. TaxID=1886636 RepID=UPI00137DC7AB|nr:DUF2894 domain-containing protein [Luteibacter sp.]KAF1006634.1 MAG: hypothetical protein GAK28_02308 [Luteibacter sp.]
MARDAFNTIRLTLIEALDRRAALHEGAARKAIAAKLAMLEDVDETSSDAASTEPARGPLGLLVDAMRPPAPSYPELPALDDIHRTWDVLRSETQFRQSLAHAPRDAGPLNSSALVHRSIALMRELSPDYLRHFLSYVDDLSWLEQMGAAAAPAVKDTPKATKTAPKKRARKPRKES